LDEKGRAAWIIDAGVGGTFFYPTAVAGQETRTGLAVFSAGKTLNTTRSARWAAKSRDIARTSLLRLISRAGFQLIDKTALSRSCRRRWRRVDLRDSQAGGAPHYHITDRLASTFEKRHGPHSTFLLDEHAYRGAWRCPLRVEFSASGEVAMEQNIA